MRMQQFLLGGLLAIALVGGPLVAGAADTPPAEHSRKAWCQDNPEQCKQAREKRAEFCKANPDKCKEAKQRRDERRKFCAANPDTCKAQRAQFKAKRDEIRARCAAEPDQCEQIKAEARQQFRDKYQHQQGQQKTQPAK